MTVRYALKPRGRMTDHPAKPPRFPYIATLLCAGCVSVAVWLFPPMLELDVTADHFGRICAGSDRSAYADVFFRVSLDPEAEWIIVPVALSDGHSFNSPVYMPTVDERPSSSDPSDTFRIVDRSKSFAVYTMDGNAPVSFRGKTVLAGRLLVDPDRRAGPGGFLDTSRGRFPADAIAGLVVGAMGVFVFTVALRHWLKERRKSREEARA